MTDGATQFQDNNDITLKIDSIFSQWQSGQLVYQDAIDEFNALREKIAAGNNPIDEGLLSLRLGIIEGYRANYDLAIQHMQHARDLFIREGVREQVLRCTLNLGETYRLKGDFAQARQYFRASYDAATNLGNIPMKITSRGNEALMLITMQRYDLAASLLQECYETNQNPWVTPEPPNTTHQRRLQQSEVIISLAICALETGQLDAAWQYAQEGLTLANQTNVPVTMGQANRVMGEVITAIGTPPDAAYSDNPDDYFATSIKTLQEVNADGEVAKTLFAQGKSLVKRQNPKLAARKLQQAIAIFTKLGMISDAAKAAEVRMKII